MPFRNKRTGKTANQEFKLMEAQFKQLVNTKLPEFVEMEAQKLVDQSFHFEEYQDGKGNKWKGRKKDKEGSKKRSDRRAILVKDGDLIKSTNTSRKDRVIIITSDLVYAQPHNEGLPGKAFGKYPFKQEKRQFMPIPGEAPPEPFDNAVEEWLDKQMDNIFD